MENSSNISTQIKKKFKPWYKKFWIWTLILICTPFLFDPSTNIFEKIVLIVCIVLLILGNTDNINGRPALDTTKDMHQNKSLKPKKTIMVFFRNIKEKIEQKRIELEKQEKELKLQQQKEKKELILQEEKKEQELKLQQQKAEEERQLQLMTWQTEDLTQYACKINELILRKNEYCFLTVNENIIWNEDRVCSKHSGYSDSTEITPIFSGTLFLTNKRIFLDNPERTKTLVLSGIVKVKPYIDGTELFRQSGKRILLTGFSDATKFNIYLQRILTDDL